MRVSKNKVFILMANECINTYDLAKKTNLSLTTLYSTLNNKRQPKPSTVGKIAKALNVEVVEILED